jgi:TolA-binding protein
VLRIEEALMDCERFDRIVLDLLYDELDELTAASARRHVEQCTRCRGILAGLRATREVGTLPLVDPPAGLELSILEAEQRARSRLPLQQRLGRGVSVLAGYAMRPQLAMAALLLLAIGSSLIFFRARPGDRNSMSVTERGVPEADHDLVAVVPAASRDRAADAHGPPAAAAQAEKKETTPMAARPGAAPSPEPEPAESPGDSAFQAALGALKEGRNKDAREQFESVAARGGTDAPQAAFHAAEAAKNDLGCSEAAKLFDQVPFHYPGTRAGYDATFQAAKCYESIGDVEKARRNYQALLDEPNYAERARNALAQLERANDPIEIASRRSRPTSAGGAKVRAQAPPASAPQQAPAKPVAAPAPAGNATGR